MRESNQDVKQTSLTSPLLNPGHWYTDSEINRLLNCQLKDGEQAHIYAAQYPFLHSTTISQATTGFFQAILKQCLTSAIPSIIPVNCLEQAEVDDNGLPTSQVQIGSHWFLVVVEPKEEQVYQLTVIDSYGNGLERNIDITQKSMLDLLSMVNSHEPSYSFWIRVSRLKGIIEGLLRKEKLPIKLETIVTGLEQQDDAINCGPYLVQSASDWLERHALKQHNPQKLRQLHAMMLDSVKPVTHSVSTDVAMSEPATPYNAMDINPSQLSSILSNDMVVVKQDNKEIIHSIQLLSNPQGLIAEDWQQHTLIKAIRERDTQRLEIIQTLNSNLLHKPDANKNKGLHVAALLGDEEALALYAEKYQLHDEKNKFGMTPFHLAILSGNSNTVEKWLMRRSSSAHVLLPLKLDINTEISISLSPLNLAIFLGRKAVVKRMFQVLNDKQEINNKHVVASSLGSPLHVAIVSRWADMLEFLLSDDGLREWATGFLESHNNEQETPLAYAARVGHTFAIETLVNKGTDINSENNHFKRTALHFAIESAKPKAVECLIKLGADLNRNSEEQIDEKLKKRTPLQLAEKLKKQKSELDNELTTICYLLENAEGARKRSHGFLPKSDITYRNIVIQGGGAKGLAYIGAFEILEQRGILKHLKRVAGTSAGAITALLVALNFSYQDIERILLNLSMQKMLGNEAESFERVISAKKAIAEWLKEFDKEEIKQGGYYTKTKETVKGLYNNASHVGVLLRLLKKIGYDTAVSDGRALEMWLKELVAEKLAKDFSKHNKTYDKNYLENLTFKRLRDLIKDNMGYKHLHVFATNITQEEIVCFTTEEERWDNLNVLEAVCASAALPFVFAPRALSYPSAKDSQKTEISHFVDGGLLKNRPIEHFDKLYYQDKFIDAQWRWQERTNQQTLGLFLDSIEPITDLDSAINFCREAVESESIGIGTLIYRMGTFIYNAEQVLQGLRKDIEPRRILINVYPTETTDFDIVQDDEKLQHLIKQGKVATLDFFNPKQQQRVYTQPQRYTHFQPQMQGIPQQPVEIREDDSLQPSASTNNPNFQ